MSLRRASRRLGSFMTTTSTSTDMSHSGFSRAAGDVDHGGLDARLLQVLLDAHSVGGVGMGRAPAAVDRAGAQRDHRVGALGGIDQGRGAHLAGDAQGVAAPSLQNRTLIHKNVVARLDGLGLGLLHRMASRGGQRLRVVQGDQIQHDRGNVGSLHLGERLRAARAGSALDPDDRVEVTLRCADDRLLERLGARAERRAR